MDLQEAAESAVDSRQDDNVLRRLSESGAGGVHKGNCSRDVTRVFDRTSKMPPTYTAPIPFWNSDTASQFQDNCEFILPYEVIDAFITEENIDEFTSVGADTPLQATMDEWRTNVGIEDADEPVVGIGLWGDSAPYHTRIQLS